MTVRGIQRMVWIGAACVLFSGMPAAARVLQVGPGRALTVPSQAAAAAADGDTVDIDAGEYVDCATWTASNLLIRGVGGRAHVRDRACGGKAIWVIQGRNTTVEWIEFSGAAVQDRNGAGIRQEGSGLTVRHCLFRDSEEGILAGDRAGSEILVEYTEFARNGAGDGYSHNMYINHVARFTLRYCASHHAKVGHNVKSRAYETLLLCNYIADEADGTSSRDVDIPNGGFAVLAGNVIHQGPRTQNSNMIGYGLEGLSNPSRTLVLANNTLVNDRGSGSFLNIPASGTDTLRLVNTLFVGAGTFVAGGASVLDTAANLSVRDPAQGGFVDPAHYDYHLLPASPAVNAGIDPGSVRGIPLLPAEEYHAVAGSVVRTRVGAPDIGAFECATASSGDAVVSPRGFSVGAVYPNPTTGGVSVECTLTRPAPVSLEIVALNGAVEWRGAVMAGGGTHRMVLPTAGLPRGAHLLRLRSVDGSAVRIFFAR